MAWQQAMSRVAEVYRATAGFPPEEKFGLVSKMGRATVSVPGNIAEGAARESQREFVRFLSVACGSLSELDTQWLLAQQLGLAESAPTLDRQIDRVFGLLGGLLNAMQKEIRA
jgi:four helix bundle protein